MGRGIGAVIIGVFYAGASTWLLQLLLWFAFAEAPADPEDASPPVSEARLGLTVAAVFVSCVVSGFMTAYLAGRLELLHGLTLGTLLLAVLAVNTLFIEPEPMPPWYQLALPGVALPAVLLGAQLRAWSKRAPAPPPDKPA